jgi:aryl sulfotransferase
MKLKKNTVWLASYPKSGNTWFRAFLTAYLHPDTSEIDINDLHTTAIASNRQFFDEVSGVASADLLPDEIEKLRPQVYRQYSAGSKETLFYKIHDAWKKLQDGSSMFPAEITKGVIYIIRNPLDVAVSFSDHLGKSIDRTIEIMNNPEFTFSGQNNRLPDQLEQYLGSWSHHVKSWVYDSKLNVKVIRYEDLKTNPLHTFKEALQFLGYRTTHIRIQKAIDLTSFEKLQAQEKNKGFSEKSNKSSLFFRSGRAGEGKIQLTREQKSLIFHVHNEMIQTFGYR